ncbi:hypothetical protein AXI58_01595 [Bacillus nakamurai]|uniref:Uncharacterized protein n=1 Tax=Bacillus nakamurai TaxID=1793963 RepID=A0A150F4S5_9BACI|nr:hypothetical protein AXI58_01595 [Bacillus nakamurai]
MSNDVLEIAKQHPTAYNNLVFNLMEAERKRMMKNKLNQEEFLKILMHAHDIGEQSSEMTTKEMLENLISHIKNGYAT